MLFTSTKVEALSYREQKDVKELLSFMATHRVVTLGLRFNELLALSERTLSIHPLELTCFILNDPDTFSCFKKINRNFFKQQYLLNQWSEVFQTGYHTLELDQMREMIENSGLNWSMVEECVNCNYYIDLMRELIARCRD